MIYKITVTPPARQLLREIKDVRVQRKLGERIEALAENPELQGKPLGEELVGFRSVRAVGQKFRIIYKVEQNIVTVLVVALGRRQEGSKSDVYELTKKLIRAGLIQPPNKK